eukprot:NODE_100_length_20777_cov_0.240884.p23 type:complete len:111 gc:universal NODE_100_length_20777_cov_0.240884:18072-17740(-)
MCFQYSHNPSILQNIEIFLFQPCDQQYFLLRMILPQLEELSSSPLLEGETDVITLENGIEFNILKVSCSLWFLGVGGYHVSLTRTRSPVRAWQEPLFCTFSQAIVCSDRK